MSRRWLPESLRLRLRAAQRRLRLHRHRVGGVDFGDLRRLRPISPVFGFDRSLPLIDRYYIEHFLERHAADIRGRVLELGDATYTQRFGGDRVTHSDVLHSVEGNAEATLVADLAGPEPLPADRFDCIIATQTLQMIFDVRRALGSLYRMLRPGGVLLTTSHGISRIARREGVDPWGEYWHFTAQSTRRLFEEWFEPGGLEVLTYGNVLSAAASLYGLSADDLEPAELDHHDPDFELVIGVRACKSGPGGIAAPA
jgi:SAM-dependent methyltransferase